MTAGVETTEVAIQLAFGGPNAGFVRNDQWSIDAYYGATSTGLGLNPCQDVVCGLKAVDFASTQVTAVQAE